MTARDASVALGKNEKYIYLLWKRGSAMLLADSVKLKGSTLLITIEGYEHLKKVTKKESDLAIRLTNCKVFSEVLVSLRNSRRYIILKKPD